MLALSVLISAAPASGGDPDRVEELNALAAAYSSQGWHDQAAELYVEADRESQGRSLEAVAGLCRETLELGRTEESFAAAGRWLALAATPAERAAAHRHLGLARVQEAAAVRRDDRSATERTETELRQAAQAFRLAADENGEDRPRDLLDLASVLLRLDERLEAREVLDEYAAGGGDSPLAEHLRRLTEVEATGEPPRPRVEATGEPPEPKDEVATIGGNVRAPVKLYAPGPQYTDEARKARVEGVVIVQMVVDKEGRVSQPRILRGLDEGMDRSVLETLRTWRFEPATRDGEPVAVYYNLTVDFTLADQRPLPRPTPLLPN